MPFHDPVCPKCGESDWTATETNVGEHSAVRAGMQLIQSGSQDVTHTDIMRAMNDTKYFDVVFIHCHECGHVLTAKIID